MKNLKLIFKIILILIFFTDCSKGDSSENNMDFNSDLPYISLNKSFLSFEDTMLTKSSITKSILISKESK